MSYCISGQGQEYLGFLNFLVHQTLAAPKKELTNRIVATYDNVKDWELLDMSGPVDSDDGVGTGTGLEGPVTKGKNKCLMPTDIAEYTLAKFTSNTKAQIDSVIDTDVAAINSSHSDMTVTNIIFNVGPGTAQYTTGNSVYGAAWLKTAADAQNKVSVSTTIYDKIIAAGHKVIHLGWHDLTDDNDHWLRAMARYEASKDSSNDDVTGTKTWDERRGHFARNIAGITFPTTDNDHTVKIDKLLNKDATEYASLCTFLGLAPLSASTWKGYVDSYINDIT
tara:strand:+ start:127 stop:963 length:837 start_codon:yes stop_codon:yes gene_type:complete